MDNSLIFLGAVRTKRENYREFLADPRATRSTKPKSQEDEVARKKADQEANASAIPTAGYVQHLVVLNGEGECLLNSTASNDDDAGRPAIDFTNLMLARPEWHPHLGPLTTNGVGVRWWGFQIRDVLDMLALTALRYGAVFPANLWLFRPFEADPVADPYHVLVRTAQRDNIGIPQLCTFLGLALPETPDYRYDAGMRAEVARQLVLRGNLAG
jgi:hypothetical protein